MHTPISDDAIVVLDSSVNSDEPYDIVQSNINYINALGQEYLRDEEISKDAYRSYYVDYYLSEINNGGFSQFVYNSRWNPPVIEFVREGLRAVNAPRHLELFEKAALFVKVLGPERLDAYFSSEYFGENPFRDLLNSVAGNFFDIDKTESLLDLNAAWLRRHPRLVVLSSEQMAGEIRRRGEAVPDRAARIAEAEAKAPPYLKNIRALCTKAGHKLEGLLALKPDFQYEGNTVVAFNFITDTGQGLYRMIEVGTKAIMLDGETNKPVCEVEAVK